jgi:radical SAM superfamily enzyme YgiQ (UPF0313 family)
MNNPPIYFVRLALSYDKDPMPRDSMPPFFLMQTMRILRDDHGTDSRLFDQCLNGSAVNDLMKELASGKEALIIISTESNYIPECLELAERIKSKDRSIRCITVGHAATYCWDRLCFPGSPVDYAIRGEFPVILADMIIKLLNGSGIAEEINNGKVFHHTANASPKMNIIEDLNDLPFVPSEEEEMKKYYNVVPLPIPRRLVWGRVFSTYGCPNACGFCTQTVRLTYGSEYRLKDIGMIMSEIKTALANGANIIEFMDDNFTGSREHVTEVCKAIIESGIKFKWGTHVRIDETDHDILLLMKKAGMCYVRCGIESGSVRIVQAIGKAKNAGDWNKKVADFFAATKKHGIITIAYVILGTPGETEEDVKMTKDLIMAVGPSIIKTHSYCEYPGSPNYRKKGKDFSDSELSVLSHHGKFSFHENPILWKKLENDLLLSFYLRPRFLTAHFFKYAGFYVFNMQCTYILLSYFFNLIKPAGKGAPV